MGMSNWILDNEEVFWDYAQENILDCFSEQEFVQKMLEKYTLVSHLPMENVVAQLSEMWYNMTDHYREIA